MNLELEAPSAGAASSAAPAEAQFILSPREAGALWTAVGELIKHDLETLTPDEYVDLALTVPALFPSPMRRRLIEYRRRAPTGDVLLLRGLIPEGVEIPPSVAISSAPPTGPVSQRAALLLLGVSTLFGEPFNYATLWDGRLVQNMIPVRGAEFEQTSQSSQGTLDWHVEDGFREDRCDYAALLCLRGDPAAVSMYAQAKELKLSPQLEATLREERFQLRPDTAHVLSGEVPLRQVTVLTGPQHAPEICYDTHHITPIDDADAEGAQALRALHACLDEAGRSHVMERGDLLIFDNRRVVHGRGPFKARFDGTDRWLMRTMICGSAPRFRRWGRRIIE